MDVIGQRSGWASDNKARCTFLTAWSVYSTSCSFVMLRSDNKYMHLTARPKPNDLRQYFSLHAITIIFTSVFAFKLRAVEAMAKVLQDAPAKASSLLSQLEEDHLLSLFLSFPWSFLLYTWLSSADSTADYFLAHLLQSCSGYDVLDKLADDVDNSTKDEIISFCRIVYAHQFPEQVKTFRRVTP